MDGKPRVNPGNVIIAAIIGIAIIGFLAKNASNAPSGDSTASSTVAQAQQPDQSQAQQPDSSQAADASTGDGVLSKSEEVSRAHTSGSTAQKVYGNPAKWLGMYVRFPCKISNVIDLGNGSSGANAQCGQGVTATLDTTPPDVDYSDPDAVAKAERAIQSRTDAAMKRMQDNAMLVLVGTKASSLDGGQVITVTGQVLAPSDGTNAMGAKMSFPTVRIDYAE